jgi:DNA-binding GntR family transcriptional regulator
MLKHGWRPLMKRPSVSPASSLHAITIDRTSPVPLYFQLAQQIEAGIRSGSLPVGTRLDNEVQLAEGLGLSRPTVRAAFLYLAQKGMVARKRGYGTVVTREKISRDVELTSLHDDLSRAGKQPSTRVLRNEVGEASDIVAEALELPEGALVICLERLREADGEPIALMRNFLPAAMVHLSDEMLAQHGLYELLRASGIRLSSATQRMSAKNASASEARILDEPRGAALLTIERLVRDDRDRPVEFAQHVYRASRYAVSTSLRTS